MGALRRHPIMKTYEISSSGDRRFYLPYTGVGSRKTPAEIRQIISKIAKRAAQLKMTLRSGGAQGADLAFEWAAKRVPDSPAPEIFYASDATDECRKLAAQVHPAWDRCSDFVRNLHGRNALQVLGRSLNDPSRFLVCWTPDGAECEAECSIRTGGTGTAIRMASRNHIPVFNLARPNALPRLREFVHKILPHCATCGHKLDSCTCGSTATTTTTTKSANV